MSAVAFFAVLAFESVERRLSPPRGSDEDSPHCSDRRRRHREEVIPAGIEIINLAAEQGGFTCEFTPIPWGCDYLQTGRMMDTDGVSQLLKFDAIYLGAIGDPRVADHISARELILPLRQKLGQWVNLRPMRLMPGIVAARRPRRRRHRHDLRARELRGRNAAAWADACAGTPCELAEQTGVFTGTASSASRATRSAGRITSAEDAGQRDEVERAAARDGVVG